MTHRLLFRSLWVALFATCGAAGAAAQLIPNPLAKPSESAAAVDATAPAEQPLADKRAENAERLRLAQRKLDEADSTDSAAAQEVALFKTVEAVLAQQEAVDQQIKDIETRKADLKSQLESVPTVGPDSQEKTSFIDLDRLKDELNAEKARAKLVAAKLAAAKAALTRAQQALDASETARRQAEEAAKANPDAPNAAEPAAAAEQAKQAAKLAAETVTLRKKEVAREELAQQVQKLSAELLQQRINRVAPRVVLSEAALKEQLDHIKKQEEALKATRAKAESGLQEAQWRLDEARRQHKAAPDDPVAAAREKTREAAQKKLTAEVSSLIQQLQRLADARLAWNRRYQIASLRPEPGAESGDQVTQEELKKWQAETRRTLDDSASDTRAQILAMSDLRNELATVAKNADVAKDASPELAQWIERQRRHLEETLRIHESNLVSIESARRVHERLLGEIGRDVEALTQLALGARDRFSAVWNYKLAQIDTDEITAKMVVKGILIFIFGWIVSRILASLFAHRLLRRFRMSQDATTAIKALSFYTLLVIATLIALNVVNIPLTAFTILGGALAIGVGFGSQALINNFISGLIMLAERPVRIGERVVFGSYDGTVEEVGFRSTKLRTLTDHLVTIPNSNLVNEPIENIGRRRTIRRLLNITITYDTPREKITQAVEAVRSILEEPGIREPIHPIIGWDKFPPRVYFNDYNAESLNILVVYWYAPPEFFDYLDHCQKVNLRIYEEFEQLGVDFAFPSRTLYLAGDAKRELAVRLSSEGGRMHDAA